MNTKDLTHPKSCASASSATPAPVVLMILGLRGAWPDGRSCGLCWNPLVHRRIMWEPEPSGTGEGQADDTAARRPDGGDPANGSRVPNGVFRPGMGQRRIHAAGAVRIILPGGGRTRQRVAGMGAGARSGSEDVRSVYVYDGADGRACGFVPAGNRAGGEGGFVCGVAGGVALHGIV